MRSGSRRIRASSAAVGFACLAAGALTFVAAGQQPGQPTGNPQRPTFRAAANFVPWADHRTYMEVSIAGDAGLLDNLVGLLSQLGFERLWEE